MYQYTLVEKEQQEVKEEMQREMGCNIWEEYRSGRCTK